MRKIALIALAFAFTYGNEVLVIDGFYKGCQGRVIGFKEKPELYVVHCVIKHDIIETAVKPEHLKLIKE